MIEYIEIKSFKSLFDVKKVELGKLNVFIGANGSGKSNFLEAIGVLSAAADGSVNDQSLLCRGVRTGVPKLYKSSFQNEKTPQHISLTARNQSSKYSVSLHNPLESPEPDWQYKHEKWIQYLKSDKERKLASRGPRKVSNKTDGMAKGEAYHLPENNPAHQFLKTLRNYRIYTPTTGVLRGTTREAQPANPLGLSGGRLPEAVGEMLRLKQTQKDKDNGYYAGIIRDFFRLISWTKKISVTRSSSMPLSPSAAASPKVVRFVDKFMAEGRNELSGYEASEGALYVLFLMVLVALPTAPAFCAIDNADHGLNPLLAKQLFQNLSKWMIDNESEKQLLVTTHNPLVLDGLLINDDRIRLFAVDRTDSGKTEITRIEITDEHWKTAQKNGLTLSRMWTMGYLGGTHHV